MDWFLLPIPLFCDTECWLLSLMGRNGTDFEQPNLYGSLYAVNNILEVWSTYLDLHSSLVRNSLPHKQLLHLKCSRDWKALRWKNINPERLNKEFLIIATCHQHQNPGNLISSEMSALYLPFMDPLIQVCLAGEDRAHGY